MRQRADLACACGQVRLEAVGKPIASTECHCNSCRAAAAKLQALPAAQSLLEPNGGTRSVLYRKDRVHFVTGTKLLKEFRLAPNANTRRVIAVCCSSPVFMEFQNSHWLDLYGKLWPKGALPPLDYRTMTSDLRDTSVLDDAVPNARRQPVSFFVKLLGAWIAMGLARPKITFVEGDLHALERQGHN